MKKYLKSSGVVLAVFALLLSILSGCKEVDLKNSDNTSDTASETFAKNHFVSKTYSEGADSESDTEDITSAADTGITAGSDKTTNADERPKEPESTAEQKKPATDKIPPSPEKEKEPEKTNTTSRLHILRFLPALPRFREVSERPLII